MNLALTIFAVAFVLGAVILLNKRREMSRGKPWFFIGGSELDQAVYDAVEFFIYVTTHASVKRTKMLFRKALLSAEKFFLGAFERIGHRFGIVSDIITGKDLPKNRGSVSFFLKNIEVSKRNRCKKI
ncbi:MAG TPA: hypothetical protein VGE62_01345 [Candidatus Paceibacterota bacterium]